MSVEREGAVGGGEVGEIEGGLWRKIRSRPNSALQMDHLSSFSPVPPFVRLLTSSSCSSWKFYPYVRHTSSVHSSSTIPLRKKQFRFPLCLFFSLLALCIHFLFVLYKLGSHRLRVWWYRFFYLSVILPHPLSSSFFDLFQVGPLLFGNRDHWTNFCYLLSPYLFYFIISHGRPFPSGFI